MTVVDRPTLRVLWTTALFIGALLLVWLALKVLLLFVFAVFFAYLVFPLVWLVERWRPLRRRRTLAIVVVYVVLLAALGGAGAAVAPRLAAETTLLAQRLPEMSQQVKSGTIVGDVLERRGLNSALAREVEGFVRENAWQLTGWAQGAAAGALTAVAGAWVVVLVPIFAFFVLKDGDDFAAAIERGLGTRTRRSLWRDIVTDVHHLLGEYVRALIVLSLFTAVVWAVVFSIARVPYAVMLAVGGGVFEFMPVVGPAVAAVCVMAIALLAGFPHPWLLLLFLIVWRLVQDYVNGPRVMGSGTELHPALVIFGVLAGGEIGGPVGAFLAVPIIAAARVLWRRLRPAEVMAADSAPDDTAAPRTRSERAGRPAVR